MVGTARLYIGPFLKASPQAKSLLQFSSIQKVKLMLVLCQYLEYGAK